MKLAFYKLNHGEDFDPEKLEAPNKTLHGGHFKTRAFYRLNHAFYEDFSRIAIIREPAKRIMSAYWDRVVRLGELAESAIDMDLARALKVAPDPGRGEFIRKLPAYRLLSKSIKHHTDPFTFFLGHDMRYFTDVVKIGKLDTFAAQVEALTGREFKIPHANGQNATPPSLTMNPAARRSLLAYCAGDYALLKGYYKIPPALLE